MDQAQSTIDPQEVKKFNQHAAYWWDKDGPLKTLHDINETRLEFVGKHISLAGLKVLDVGCGGGVLCEAMAKQGAIVTGLDAASEAIKTAQAHAASEQLEIHYECMPVEDYEGASFDVITCMELLEHISNPEVVLAHCKRLLKPGGYLFLSTINRTLKAYAFAIVAAEYLLKLLPRQTHEYHKFIKPSELVSITRCLDFNLLDMKGMHYNPLSRVASLSEDVGVNYLLALQGG